METETTEHTNIEVVIDEELSTGSRCEHNHTNNATPCSIVAVAFGQPRCLGKPLELICQSFVNRIDSLISIGLPCGHCDQPIAECWIVVPI